MSRYCNRFLFGVEAEFMLVDTETYRPLWYPDLKFDRLFNLLAEIPTEDLPALDGLELEAPHRKLMPYVVEGYHIPDPEYNPIDLLPKGVEIRTPVCDSVDQCIRCLSALFERMQTALETIGYRAVTLSHHPVATHFEGPQNKRRYDFWRWAMEVMTTYGPDINISLPSELNDRLDYKDLHAKADYYGPALAALALASPFRDGKLWRIRGRTGKSLRTYRRSVFGQCIELHPEEDGRLEFKLFEMTSSLDDFAAYLLLWLALLLDNGLKGRASYQTRVYDLGQIAQLGFGAEGVVARAAEVLERAPEVLRSHGFDPRPLEGLYWRIDERRVPADALIEQFEQCGTIEGVLRQLDRLQ